MKTLKLLVAACAAVLMTLGAQTAELRGGMSEAALSNFNAQVAQIYAMKRARSAAESKVDLQILSQCSPNLRTKALDVRSGASVKAVSSTNDMIECNIRCKVSDRLLEMLRGKRVTIISVSETFGAVHAVVPSAAIRSVAEDPDVTAIAKVFPAEHQKKTTSEGVVAHQVNQAKKNYGVTGKGLNVGVISDGCDDLASLQASGDLPSGVKVISGRKGAGYEGSAMMEIIYDLAPDAKLFFADGGATCEEFAEGILALQRAGCNVIVDDLYRADEPAFEEGAIAKAINTVTAAGVVYVTSACNYGRTSVGTSRVWNGDFVDVGVTFKGGQLHKFFDGAPWGYYKIPMKAVNWCQGMNPETPFVQLTLQWSDKWGASANDYDLFFVNLCNGDVLVSSVNVQSGKGDPFEAMSVATSALYDDGGLTYLPVFVIVKKTDAEPRFLRLSISSGALLGVATEGSITGHNGCEAAITCAAAPVPETSRAFTAADELENFSSDGPCYRFFKANGQPYTAGNFLKSGAKAINKPDITAADKVSCSAKTFDTFSGTSAAAPHVAAIAALMLEAKPGLSPAQVKGLMTKSVFQPSYGWNRNSGYGILDAALCVKNAKAYKAVYTVAFAGNGATSGSMSAQTYERGKIYTLPKCAFKKTGKTFKGWAGSNGKRYDDGVLVVNAAEEGETLTLTAIWE